MTEADVKNLKYEKLQPKEFLKISKWVVRILLEVNKKFTITYFVAATLISLYSIANTYLLTRILDVIVSITQQSGAAIQDTFPYLGIMLGLSLTEKVIAFAHRYSSNGLDFVIRPEMERQLYLKLKALGIQTLEEPGINDKINRANRQLHEIVSYYFRFIESMVSGISLVVRAFIIFTAVPLVIPLIVLFSLPKYFSDKKHRGLVWKFGYETTEKRRKGYMHSYYLQTTSFLEEILISGGYRFLDEKFSKFVEWVTQKNMELRKKWFISMHSFEFLTDLSVYLGYLMAISRAFMAQITVGDVFFQINLINSLSGELNNFFNRLNTAFESAIRVKDTYTLFEAKPAFEDGTTTLPRLTKGPEINIEGVTFKYPRASGYALNSVDLKIKSGEKVAIVGHNGAGKTTLIKLIARMYRPTFGKILVEGTDLNDVQIDTWYQNIGVLFQEYNQYHSLNVRENVYIGGYDNDNKVDEKAMIEALNRADALDFVNEFPKKFEQILSEKYTGGIRPSSGQWQKLAIARFFYRNSPLVIFDEPTASIDAVSEYNIFNKIYGFFEGKTVIIISHRFSTVRNADRIIVLDKGRIVEEGTHNELMKKDGQYAKSFKLQAEGYSIAPDSA